LKTSGAPLGFCNLGFRKLIVAYFVPQSTLQGKVSLSGKQVRFSYKSRHKNCTVFVTNRSFNVKCLDDVKPA
jgi:hypothetical protein